MAIDINKFKAEIIRGGGVLRTHSFEVEIGVPQYLRGRYVNTEIYSLRCEAASLPGMSIASIDGQPKYGYGPVEMFPYSVTYDTISLTFIVDRNSEVHRFFYDWMGCIVNFDSGGGSIDSSREFNGTRFAAYEVGYKSKYATDLKVKVFDEKLDLVQTLKAYRAFPRAINQIDLNWENQNNIMKLIIPFSFREYTIDFNNRGLRGGAPRPPTAPPQETPKGNVPAPQQVAPAVAQRQVPSTTSGPTVFKPGGGSFGGGGASGGWA